MVTVSIHSSLCDNENPTTHSICVGLDVSVVLVSESMSSSSESSTPCSFVRRSSSLMCVCESHATFCCLDSNIVFLRTRLSWVRTAFSTFGCDNRFLCLLCIHPLMLHICSHTETLVMTEHNFFANHARFVKQSLSLFIHDILHERFHQVCYDLFIFRCVKAPSGWSC